MPIDEALRDTHRMRSEDSPNPGLVEWGRIVRPPVHGDRGFVLAEVEQ
jgi:hypothetical protein